MAKEEQVAPSRAQPILFSMFSNVDIEGSTYVNLMRTVYKLANSTASVPVLTIGLLRELFVNLKDDALAFLAGVWATCLDSAAVASTSCRRVFGGAYSGGGWRGFPDDTWFSRKLAKQRFSAVYAFDAIYGESEVKLQYLSQGDLTKYLDAIVEHRATRAPFAGPGIC
ncbi:hypothetical protein C8J57DRAFT_1507853 [Mycena rebaudengoi]|nr:hypothetical protein C8J57DRAFT_1507853 [Mycena rebaudengoi]